MWERLGFTRGVGFWFSKWCCEWELGSGNGFERDELFLDREIGGVLTFCLMEFRETRRIRKRLWEGNHIREILRILNFEFKIKDDFGREFKKLISEL